MMPLWPGRARARRSWSDATNWLTTPTSTDEPVDVFYVYPTAYQKADASAPDIAAVTDAGMRTGAQAAYARQATAFADVAEVAELRP